MLGNASPSPQGREDENFRKSHGMKIYKNNNLYSRSDLFFFFVIISPHYQIQAFIKFSIKNTRRHPEPRIPPDSRSVQILYRISGMLNESNHSHIGDGTFHNSLRWYKWESSVPGHFCKRD